MTSAGRSGALRTDLPRATRLLAVCAHPDDESFGLGAVLSAYVDAGCQADLLCLTRGGSSTLGGPTDLSARRTQELACAAEALRLDRIRVEDHPDGTLADVPMAQLVDDILRASTDADLLLVYDHGGITGHPDHQRATDAAIRTARERSLPVLAWALSHEVAATLNREFGASFVGRADTELTHRITVDRRRQEEAMACHTSQLDGNPIPQRRLQLQGQTEVLRELWTPAR